MDRILNVLKNNLGLLAGLALVVCIVLLAFGVPKNISGMGMLLLPMAFGTLVVPNVGEDLALKALLNHTAGLNQTLKLYTSNTTPAETDTAATYTEASGNGYSAINLTGSSWSFTPGAPSQGAYAEQTFTFTGALGNVYGYFVVQQTTGTLLWAERFTGAPFNIANNGDQIKVTPVITAD